ncbi:MAG: type II toxin-antitoxin system HicB family antitoxin [bacterium]|nr:type II toxin-antitoxin system HicB family antitoxin [bacterium]
MLKQTRKVLEYELKVEIKPQKEGGFIAVCPDWSDCYAQGDTIDEAILEITAVAQSLVELYKEERLDIPLKLQKEKGIANLFTVPVIVTA